MLPPGDPAGTPHHPSPASLHAAQAVVDAVQALVSTGAVAALVTALRVARTWEGRDQLIGGEAEHPPDPTARML